MKSKICKFALITIIVAMALGILFFFTNSLFGNPVSKIIAKNTALEYIEENYPDSDCQIEYVSFDANYGDYNAHIISTTNPDIDFSLCISSTGEITVIEYWEP